MTDNELLQFAITSGMLDLENVASAMEMAKRKTYIEKHTYKVWQAKDGYWRTYLPNNKNGRTLIKKKDKAALDQAIIDFYKSLEEDPTIEAVFTEWNDRRFQLGKIAKATYDRNIRIFQLHYAEFGKQKIKHLKQRDFIDFLESQVSEHHMTAKSFSNLKSLTRGFLKRASSNELIDFTAEDVFNRLDLTDTTFRKIIKEDYEEVFDDQEMQKVMEYLVRNLDAANLAVTNNGTRGQKLALIENRMMTQKTTFETLKSENEDADIADATIKLTTANMVYEASLMATSKVMQNTLLDFI